MVKLHIMAPEPRVFPVTQPVAGGEIAGNGGIVSWQAIEKIARYAVEVKPVGTSWANPALISDFWYIALNGYLWILRL